MARTPPPKRPTKTTPARALKVVYLPTKSLKPDRKNARSHGERNLGAIRASIDSAGVYQPILVQAGTHRVIAGHGRLIVFKEKGLAKVPCIVLDVDDAKAREISLRDNRTAELAGWDAAKLQVLLDDLESSLELAPEDVGFDEAELDEIMESLEETDDDEADDDDHRPAASQFKVIVQCKDEGDQAKLIKSLRGKGYKCSGMTS
jgi:ParB-like chromosome segregation protein Spo0J